MFVVMHRIIKARKEIREAISNLSQLCPDGDDIDSVELKHLPCLKHNLEQALRELGDRSIKR